MASEAVNKVLSAEADASRKTAEARKTAENIITEAEKYSALAIQKKISQASAEVEKVRSDYQKRLEVYAENSGEKLSEKITEIRFSAEKNMEKAVSAVIEEFF